ncbi:MAG TPA: molybdopterin cofactor-binding domain-containing protein, partial [Planctomycetaceae bacterium]|nr:molybdopterin cofactor-binding domain-containing protein [Planctomycetaceae bacterium]
VHIIKDVDSEVHWDGDMIAAVAAERIEQAMEGVKAIEIEYETLDTYVDDRDVAAAEKAKRAKSLGKRETKDFDAALTAAAHKHTGFYGIPVISHMCMEPHGSHCEWKDKENLLAHVSTQWTSGIPGQLASAAGVDAANVTAICNYIGGGFGSKFSAGEWGLVCAVMAQKAGRPIRLVLDRATELKTPGTRPSAFAEITVGADEKGNVTCWESHHWGTNGPQGGTIDSGVVPYVFTKIKNYRRKRTGIVTDTGPFQAWRAPDHPQAAALTLTAFDDLAAKMGMDSLEFFKKNLKLTLRPELYADELEIGAKIMDWKARWHPNGKGDVKNGTRQGLGLALHTWGGGANATAVALRVNPDGTVESTSATQDLGTGTRTCIAVILAETFGIPLSSVKVHIGSSKYPNAGGSGGSTTIGGVSGPVRRAGLEALWKILDLVAKRHKVDAGSLSAKNEKIYAGDKVVCSWQQACGLLGAAPLETQSRGRKNDGLTSQGVGGIQMADVSVDVETGVVRMNKMLCVQDCGTIIDRQTAESQVLGGLIMGISYSLSEERIIDKATGRYINADLENYKLPRIGDIGELIAEFYEPDEQYKKGVVGLGEPPVISTGAAISNAVANAIGVRVPVLPLTPKRVLEALKGAKA